MSDFLLQQFYVPRALQRVFGAQPRLPGQLDEEYFFLGDQDLRRDDTNYMRHTMAYKVLEGRDDAAPGAYRAQDLLSDIRLDYKPVVQTRYEPMERKY